MMIKLISAKCPNCGALLKLSKKDEMIKCEYCNQTIMVDDAVACYKLKISGNISVDGIESNSELINSANELLSMQEYLKAKKKFLEFSEKCPDDYQGWLGLLICRTRNFTIKDNNIMFENDINKYYDHFLKVAPEDIKNDYVEIIENYLHPKASDQIVKKTIAKNFNSNFKINPKIRPFIAPAILVLMGLALLGNSIFIGGVLWCLSGIVLIPKVKDKLNFSNKKAIIFSVILGVVGFFAFAIESPYGFVGKWESLDNNYLIEFKKGDAFVLKTHGEEIDGKYSSTYENNQYTIIISTDNDDYNNIIYKYFGNKSDNKLCLYENDSCITYFKEIDEK